ncbi:MAG: 50S ribosomal protein L10 [Candidatus Latescibacteria bacterium]|nr:50S ribosomal protein L10 [Candidatus Latescibacterota bacterium]
MAQTRAEKEQVVTDLAARLAAAQSVYFTDFTGLNVELVTQFRRQLRAASVDCQVVKNTLARFAIQHAGLPGVESYLEGPTALLIAHDPVVPAKVLADFIKSNNDRPRIKGGILNGAVIAAAQVQHLATLPSREVLLSRAIGRIASPLSGLVFTLQGVLGSLVRVLAAISTQRANDAGPAETA